MLSANTVAQAIDRFSLMPFFPQDDGAKHALVKLMGEMCSTDEQVSWLARRVPQLHKNWPGEFEVRAVLCSRFKPRDGVELHSDIYQDGIPSEIAAHNYAAIGPAAEMRQIAGETQSVNTDAQTEKLVADVAATIDARNRASGFRPVFAYRVLGDKAFYNFTCGTCGHDGRIEVPIDATNFPCPSKCGASYEQRITSSGLYRIFPSKLPQDAAQGANA